MDVSGSLAAGTGNARAEASACPYPARAWWGEVLLAESTQAIRVERPDCEAELFFPVDDIRLDHLAASADPPRADADAGDLTWWSVEAAADRPVDPPEPAKAIWARPAVDNSADGTNVLRTVAGPPPGLPELGDHGCFDHDRVRVELVDGRPGDDPRDVTVKRFPTWGDASDLVAMLDVVADGERRFVGLPRSGGTRRVVEGSQLLGQAIVAAGKHAPGRRVVSGHMVFLRAGDPGRPLEFELDEHAAGRTMTTLGARVLQEGRLRAAGTLLLDVGAPDAIRHAVAAPDTPGPYDSKPYDMSVTGRDLRFVDGAYTDDPDAPVGPPVIDAWLRFRDVPPEPYLHAGLLAQFTGHVAVAAALRPHPGIGQYEAHRTLSTAINAIAIAFHAPARVDQWLLYRHHSTFAGDGMTHAECRVHTEAGDLVASFTVDAMVRRFAADGATAIDDRTAL